MSGVFLTPLAKLLELNFTLHFLFILSGPVISPFTGLAGQFY